MQEFPAVPSGKALTVAVVARRLDVAEKTVYRAVRRGEFPCIRVGRSIRIPESALAPPERPS
jgi:excisionase family DNA binding protein